MLFEFQKDILTPEKVYLTSYAKIILRQNPHKDTKKKTKNCLMGTTDPFFSDLGGLGFFFFFFCVNVAKIL